MTTTEAAQAAWLEYRDEMHRSRPWCDQRRVGRQMRRRDFIAGYLAATPPPPEPLTTDADRVREVAL